jgi:Fe-S oxidoreductase
MNVLSRKMDNLERTGANVLATSCPSCIVQLRHGVRMRGLPVKVCHISEILRGEAAPAAGGQSRQKAQNDLPRRRGNHM